MGDKSKIDWTDATWNPIVGCSIISPACTNCYAMAQAARIEAMRVGSWRKQLSPDTPVPDGPYTGLTQPSNAGAVWTGKVALAFAQVTGVAEPLRWRRPRKIFVNSMGDLFHESVPDEWIDRVFAVMALAPQHVFQVLTKRAKRMRDYLFHPTRSVGIGLAALGAVMAEHARNPKSSVGSGCIIKATDINPGALKAWPLPNVWLGVTAEDQARADERIPDLLATPAAKRFISAEPLLSPLDVRWALGSPIEIAAGFLARGHFAPGLETLRPLDQIITGGESGPNARPSHPDWFRSLRDQCAVSGTAYFFKQWGEWAPAGGWYEDHPVSLPLRGLGPNGWTDDNEVLVSTEYLARVGKRRAGHLLDGREHREFPA